MSRRRAKEPPPPGRYRPFEDLQVDRRDGQSASPAPPERPPEPPQGEDDDFARSVRDVVPLPGKPGLAPEPSPRPARLPDEDGEWRTFASGLLRGAVGFDISWSDEYIEGRRREVSLATMGRLRRGEFAWQDHLDLHGMTRVEAREAVERFIDSSRARHLRCILIVHGRGKGSEGGLPVLKEKLVAWLTREGGLGSRVLAFTTARPCDGGFGAIYVLIRST